MAASTETRKNNNHTILVVDDDAGIVMLIDHLLTMDGHHILKAKNGAEALAVLDRDAPDVILLDIMLPDINGLDLLRDIKALPLFRNIPVLILSGTEDIGSKVDGLDAGAEDYIVKPINKLELKARVRVAVRKSESERRLKVDFDAAFQQSITDNLTGLYNRHHLNGFIEREIAGSKRYNKTFSFIVLDLDFFKKINDTFGHLSGDSVLRELACILKEQTRAVDLVARYGGEEFVAVLPETGIDDGLKTAEKLRQTIEDYRFSMVDGKAVTVSMGITEFRHDDGDMQAVFKRADDALYLAKKSGRNRVEKG